MLAPLLPHKANVAEHIVPADMVTHVTPGLPKYIFDALHAVCSRSPSQVTAIREHLGAWTARAHSVVVQDCRPQIVCTQELVTVLVSREIAERRIHFHGSCAPGSDGISAIRATVLRSITAAPRRVAAPYERQTSRLILAIRLVASSAEAPEPAANPIHLRRPSQTVSPPTVMGSCAE